MTWLDGYDVDGRAIAQIIVERVFGLGKRYIAAFLELEPTISFRFQIEFDGREGYVGGLRLLPCCIDGVPHRYLVDVETEVEKHGYLGVGDEVLDDGV